MQISECRIIRQDGSQSGPVSKDIDKSLSLQFMTFDESEILSFSFSKILSGSFTINGITLNPKTEKTVNCSKIIVPLEGTLVVYAFFVGSKKKTLKKEVSSYFCSQRKKIAYPSLRAGLEETLSFLTGLGADYLAIDASSLTDAEKKELFQGVRLPSDIYCFVLMKQSNAAPFDYSPNRPIVGGKKSFLFSFSRYFVLFLLQFFLFYSLVFGAWNLRNNFSFLGSSLLTLGFICFFFLLLYLVILIKSEPTRNIAFLSSASLLLGTIFSYFLLTSNAAKATSGLPMVIGITLFQGCLFLPVLLQTVLCQIRAKQGKREKRR